MGSSVDKSMLICEATMHLHNFLVSYRDDHDVNYNYEKNAFNNDCSDNGFTSEVIGNDFRQQVGRPSVAGEASRREGLLVRDKFKYLFMEHDMHRPKLANT